MHEKSLYTLEYPKILEKVAKEASFSVSKELVLALRPTSDLDIARTRLRATSEASRLLDLQTDISVRGAFDIRPHLVRAARDGVLSPQELVRIGDTTRSMLFVGRTLARLEPEPFPQLSTLGRDMPLHPQVVRRIEEIVSDEGEILDTASPKLQQLRYSIRSTNQRLQERLRSLVGQFAPYLQDSLVTMRNDRFVIPVKAESKSHVRGIVHDQSSSGATVFIEPMVVVELNNELRELHLQEKQEIDRILMVASNEIGKDADTLRWGVEILAEFDLHLAKARYARLIRASEPKLNDQGLLNLYNARHPLLTGNVVPIDFRTGYDYFMVLITGPNTGGKTVALKTIGLLTLMAQAGLHIPADEHSELSVFANIFADIGDEQSIEQSLSTFSSHLTRIIEILGAIDEDLKEQTLNVRGRLADSLNQGKGERSRLLVLFDELGAGTDPSEGSALARAILSHLLSRHVSTVATTHYSELKAFAYEHPDVVNASVEFNIETLSPTYRLSIGVPGRSNALAIATRLGLDPEIIKQGREFLGSTGVQMENLLEGLQEKQKAVSDEHYQISLSRADVDYQRKQLEEERYQLAADRVRILNEARNEARRELDGVLRELGKVKLGVRKATQQQNREDLEEARSLARKIEARTESIPQPERVRPQQVTQQVAEGPLQIGDTVRVLSFNQIATLLTVAPDRKTAEVQMGSMRLRVDVRNIERVSKRQAASSVERQVTIPRMEDRAPVDRQLDIRGWRVEDALEELESYLDRAAMAGLASVRIIHGKGTGALRNAVRDHLRRHALVQSSNVAPPQEGGDGATVIVLKA